MVEVPGGNAIEFALSILAAFNSSPSQVCRRVSIQPLLSKHGEKSGEEGGGKTCEQDGLDMDDGVGRTSPLWEGRNLIPEGGVVDLVDQDTEESGGLVVRVRLELRIDLDDECGSYS